jgi:predicted ester cyclase
MQDYRKLAEAGWNAYYGRDLEGCLANYADYAEVRLPGAPPFKGKDAIRAAWQMNMAAFPDEKATRIRHLVDGNTVVTEWASEATHNGPLMMPTGETLPATGKKITSAGVTVQEVNNEGKLAKQVFYFDRVEFLRQLGRMPAMEGPPPTG